MRFSARKRALSEVCAGPFIQRAPVSKTMNGFSPRAYPSVSFARESFEALGLIGRSRKIGGPR